MTISSSRSKRVLGLVAAVVATGALLAGCSAGTPTPSESTPAGTPSYGELSVQYSWIKNEEFAGEFYAYENGYYDEAGFSNVIGISTSRSSARSLTEAVVLTPSATASIVFRIWSSDSPLPSRSPTIRFRP